MYDIGLSYHVYAIDTIPYERKLDVVAGVHFEVWFYNCPLVTIMELEFLSQVTQSPPTYLFMQ